MFTELFLICIPFFIIFLFIKEFFWIKTSQNLNNKHVLITGGSSGIGKAIAIECAKKGANVSILARNIQFLKEAQKEILSYCYSKDQRVEYFSIDVTNPEKIEELIERIDNVCPVYMLFNCAGMALLSQLEDMSLKDIQQIINLNLYGTIYPTRCIIPKMKNRKEGIIVVTSSQGGLMGIYGCSAYAASKYALRGFSESLYYELKPYNISITLALPADVKTPGFENEEKTKPLETKLICEQGGLALPEDVAKRVVNDALNRKFFSILPNTNTILLTIVTAGMSPFTSFTELVLQVFLMSFGRLIGAIYLKSFEKIIENCYKKKIKEK